MSSFLVWIIVVIGFLAVAAVKNDEQKKKRTQQVEEAQRNPQEFKRAQEEKRAQQEDRKIQQDWKVHRSVNKQYDQAQKQFDQEREKRNRDEAVERARMEKAEEAERTRQGHHLGKKAKPTEPINNRHYVKPTQTPEILKRAEEQTSEDFSMDDLIEQAKKDQEKSCTMGLHEEETKADVMKQVHDLIVMGPNCTLEYERDFLSEAEDMLNQALLMS